MGLDLQPELLEAIRRAVTRNRSGIAVGCRQHQADAARIDPHCDRLLVLQQLMKRAHSSSRPLEVELLLAVRTYDIDFAGHVSNIVYIRWLEDLRLQFLNEHLPLQEQWANGV